MGIHFVSGRVLMSAPVELGEREKEKEEDAVSLDCHTNCIGALGQNSESAKMVESCVDR